MRGRPFRLALSLTFLLPLLSGRAPCYSGLEALAVKLRNVKVDGDLSDWAGAVPVVLSGPGSLSLPENRWDEPEDLLAAGYLGWEERSILLAALVFDERVSCKDATSRDFKDSDYVRFYFDLDYDAGRRWGRLFDDDLCVVLTPTGPWGRPMVKFPRYDGDPFRRALPPAVAEVASKIFPGGYVVEARLPADALDIAPREGLLCGFQFIVGDTDDGEREAEMAWSLGPGYWFDPRSFGRVRFTNPLPPQRALSLRPEALFIDLSPNILLTGPVRVRLSSFLPREKIEGRLLLRRPGEGATLTERVSVPFGSFLKVSMEATSLGDGLFLVEFEKGGFVKAKRGVCLRDLWREVWSLRAEARTALEKTLSNVALSALKEGRPDLALRALRRLFNLIGQRGGKLSLEVREKWSRP